MAGGAPAVLSDPNLAWFMCLSRPWGCPGFVGGWLTCYACVVKELKGYQQGGCVVCGSNTVLLGLALRTSAEPQSWATRSSVEAGAGGLTVLFRLQGQHVQSGPKVVSQSGQWDWHYAARNLVPRDLKALRLQFNFCEVSLDPETLEANSIALHALNIILACRLAAAAIVVRGHALGG